MLASSSFTIAPKRLGESRTSLRGSNAGSPIVSSLSRTSGSAGAEDVPDRINDKERGGGQRSGLEGPIQLNRRSFMGASSAALLAAACPCCTPALAAQTPPFAYGEEAGPLSWGGSCTSGSQQSPVDIPVTQLRGNRSLQGAGVPGAVAQQQWRFSYGRAEQVQVLNPGSGTMQVRFRPGNIWHQGSRQLELLQFHFHSPSEHAMDGRRDAMEAHLVHRDKATGTLAVLAVLLQPGASRPNRCLQQALQHAPAEAGATARCPTPVDAAGLLPRPSSGSVRPYVSYLGSLTTPPCSEVVEWCVFEQPVKVTDAQVLEFMHFAGGGSTYGHNARPLQPLHDRQMSYNYAAG